MAEYRRLFGEHLTGRSRISAGIRFRFRAGPGVEDWVRDLARREKACCAFFDFTVTVDDHEVRWDASVEDDEAARQALDGFYRLPDSLRRVVRHPEARTSRAGPARQARRSR